MANTDEWLLSAVVKGSISKLFQLLQLTSVMVCHTSHLHHHCLSPQDAFLQMPLSLPAHSSFVVPEKWHVYLFVSSVVSGPSLVGSNFGKVCQLWLHCCIVVLWTKNRLGVRLYAVSSLWYSVDGFTLCMHVLKTLVWVMLQHLAATWNKLSDTDVTKFEFDNVRTVQTFSIDSKFDDCFKHFVG